MAGAQALLTILSITAPHKEALVAISNVSRSLGSLVAGRAEPSTTEPPPKELAVVEQHARELERIRHIRNADTYEPPSESGSGGRQS
jgi:hypothetical protein